MRNKSGLPPYDAGVFFILQSREGKLWPPRSVGNVGGWLVTRMLAHMYGKSVREVARDIIDRALKMEDGDNGEQWQRRDAATATGHGDHGEDTADPSPLRRFRG
jgi:hypothetical protein